MSSGVRFIGAFLVAVVGAAALVHAPLTAVRSTSAPQANAPRGQTATRLADGRWLVVGGEDGRRSAGATIYDPASGRTTPVAGLAQPRAWHTATMLPDGKVLVIGGQAANQQPASAAEIFDPATESFFQIAVRDTSSRTGHTATLLTDGRLLIAGGIGRDGARRRDAELWSIDAAAAIPVTVTAVASSLRTPRAYHRATLQADGRVLFEEAEGGDQRSAPEAFSSTDETFAPAAADRKEATVVLAESRPLDGAVDVGEDARMVVRFSGPIANARAEAIELAGPNGAVPVRTVQAEGGRLLFIWPARALDFDADYVLNLRGLSDEGGVPVAVSAIAFATRKDSRRRDPVERAQEEWVPDADSISTGWRTGRPDSPWQTLPPLEAAGGVTALAGQVLRLDGLPLTGVTLRVGARQTETDRTGRFLLPLPDVPTGRIEMLIDGRTANRPRRTYGTFEVGVPMTAGRTTVLPYTVWMPLLDTTSRVRIPSPTTNEVVVTTSRIPGLELHLPAGTVIRDHDGKVVRELTITPIPLDRPPFALPSIEVPVYFTIQPGGAYVHTYGSGTKGAWLVYPNGPKGWAGKRIPFFHYEPGEKDWYVYGLGTVTSNRAQVVPDAAIRLYDFNGAMINTGQGPPPDAEPPGDCCGNDGDPVNLTTGLFELEQTDLSLSDVLPIALTRTYRTRDLDVRPFGIGTTHPYAMFLWSAQQYQEADLVLPDGARIHYVRTSPGTGFIGAVFEHKETTTTSATPTEFYSSTLTWNGAGWDLRLKDGMVYVMGENAPLQAIRDRYGNTIKLTWSLTNVAGSGYGNLLQVTSPHGRWIRFTYDGSNRIIEAKDPIGRTVGYTYDAQGRLWKVTDPLNQVTEYTYDADHRMLTVENRNGVVLVTNEYTAAADAPTPVGWVKKQTFADGGTFQFAYTVVNGKSTQTDVTNPRGFVRRVTFNSAGYALTNTRALGEPDQQVTSSVRQTGSQFVTSQTSPEANQTAMTYDTRGNVLSVTRLAGTAEAVTTTYTYDAVLNEVVTVTDPLNHTTTFGYDAKGNRTSIANPLNNTTTITYNATNQPTSVTDALQHTKHFTYAGPDLITTTDPLGRVTRRFVDAVGRMISQTNPIGHTVRFEYDALDRMTRVVDPLAGDTVYSYDAGGRLTSLTDARNSQTVYTYDDLDRLVGRTDPLLRIETFSYDLAGKPVQRTDRRGLVTTRNYDALNRLTKITHDDLSTIAFVYDSGNRITTIDDSVSGQITWVHDQLDRRVSETTPQGSVHYTYDAAGRRTTMTVTGQPTVSYDYDAAGRLTSVNQGTSTATLTYDAANRRATLSLPNAIVVEYAYDEASQVTGLTYKLGATTLGTLTYAYDPAGRRTSIGGTWARTGLPQAMSAATYDSANRLMQWGGLSFAYDANGSVASDGLTSYGWDARNQLTNVSGATSAQFQYDGLRRRIAKTIGAQSTQFLYDQENLVLELSAGSPTASFLGPLTMDEVWMRTDASGAQIPLADALGSLLAETDGVGTAMGQATYDPFGRTTDTTSAIATSFQYTGRERDTGITDLYFYRARFFSPTLGRFISEDPIEFEGGTNLYAYVANSPQNFTDPYGTCPSPCGVTVRCRPVDDNRSKVVGGQHCYIVTKDRDANVLTITGGEPDHQPFGFLKIWSVPGDPIRLNSLADPTFYNSEGDKVCDTVDCLNRTANRIDQMRLPYSFLGPNSNSAIAEMMSICGLPAVLPASAVGADVRLGPQRGRLGVGR